MDRDRPRLLANRNCYRFSCVSWALAQISCWLIHPCDGQTDRLTDRTAMAKTRWKQ